MLKVKNNLYWLQGYVFIDLLLKIWNFLISYLHIILILLPSKGFIHVQYNGNCNRCFIDRLQKVYNQSYSNMEPAYPGIISWCARMALERIADTDSLYHDVEHTILVTSVGQDILRGKHIKDGGVSPSDWLHFTISLLCHDIGYVRGICQGDNDYEFIINEQGDKITPPPGASDAFLTPYHVERGKIFVRERFGDTASILNADRIIANMELTRFPVPDTEDHQDTVEYPGLLRAADLIGQLSDPNYMRKINNLFHEFVETGTAAKLGYKNPADLAEGYPQFFWDSVYPYVKEGIRYLQLTQSGKQSVANLFGHIFAAEHNEYQLGPQPRKGAGSKTEKASHLREA